jgi:C4-dicarboxylate-specific signal transduction histidine kinase
LSADGERGAGRGRQELAGEAGEHEQREAYARAMAELLSYIAHEVNQPLAAIAANGNASIRWLAMDPPNIVEARSAAERTVRDARRASEVIAGMRAFFAQAPRARERVTLDALIAAAVAATAAQALRAQVSIEAPPAAAPSSLVGRRVALVQALGHLVANAIEACGDLPAPERRVRVHASAPERGEAVIVVEDTGPGFAADTLQRMFEPLFSTKPGHLGLGLAVCRSTVEDHGGRVLAQRDEDGRTRFMVTLPVEASEP